MHAVLAMSALATGSGAQCPHGMTPLDSFQVNGTEWWACEDLQQPGGALALVSSSSVEWFSKGYELYGNDAADDAASPRV
jgi:hypothetical protein